MTTEPTLTALLNGAAVNLKTLAQCYPRATCHAYSDLAWRAKRIGVKFDGHQVTVLSIWRNLNGHRSLGRAEKRRLDRRAPSFSLPLTTGELAVVLFQYFGTRVQAPDFSPEHFVVCFRQIAGHARIYSPRAPVVLT